PPTTGFLSKEILLGSLAELEVRNAPLAWLYTLALLSGAAMTMAFALRFFLGVFTGREPEGAHFHSPGLGIQIPPLLLACAALGFGLFPGALEALLQPLQVPGLQESPMPHLGLWHGLNRELLLSATALLVGAGLYVMAQRQAWRWAHVPFFLRFDRHFDRFVDALGYVAKRITLALRAD